MKIKQSADLEGLLHQFAQTQRYLQSFFGLNSLLLCVLQPNDSAGETAFPDPLVPQLVPQCERLQIVLLCSGWETVMGWNAQTMKQQNWFDWVHPEDVSETQSQLQSLLQASHLQHCQLQNRMLHTDGSDRIFAWQFTRGEDGLFYGNATEIKTIASASPKLFQPELPQAELFQLKLSPPESPRLQQSSNSMQQMLERERLLTTISQRIRQTLDLNQVLKTTVAEVRDFLQSDRVIIFQFTPAQNGQVMVESVRPGCTSILHQTIDDPCLKHLWHEPYKEGWVHQIEDIDRADLELCYREMLTQLGVRANLVVPILQNDLHPGLQQDTRSFSEQSRLWGLLIAHQCDAPRQWQQEDVSLLVQLASQVAVAIQQSELYQQVSQLNATLESQVQQRTAQLQQAFEFEATLKRITDKVRDSLDESHILQNAVRELTMALNISSCDTGIYSQQQMSTIAYEYVRGNVPTAQGRSVPIEEFPEYYEPLLRGEYLQFCWHNAIYVAGAPVRAISNRFAVLACPIIDDQGVLGDLWLYKQSDGIYEEQEIRLVQQVANQCAIAIRQARLYEAAQNQVTELERLNYLKDDFLNTISHELRTPIASIKMATDLLEIHLHQLQLLGEGNAIDRHFEILKQETQREINLINDLLDLSRLDANTEPLLLSTIDPASWLRHIVEPFIERAQTHQQTLELHIPDSAGEEPASHCLPALTTDLCDLERIITELLDNACKYTPAGETIALSVHPLPEENALQISVRNSGVEILPDEQTRIFEKFYRIPNNDPWKYNGVGLGLALVQKLVQRLGAKIQIESGDCYTSFVLTVPIELEKRI